MEFVTTTRGGRALIYEGYKYVLNRRGRDDRIFWRCGKSRSCSGALTTIENEIVSSRAHEHNHPPNEAEMIACKAVEGMKQAVKEKIDPVPAIYQEHLQGISAREDLEEVAAQLPTLSSMKSSLYRLRRKRLPPFPTSRDDTEVTLAQLATGAQPPRRAKKTLIKDRRLEELKSRFATLSLAEYVRSISAHTSI